MFLWGRKKSALGTYELTNACLGPCQRTIMKRFEKICYSF